MSQPVIPEHYLAIQECHSHFFPKVTEISAILFLSKSIYSIVKDRYKLVNLMLDVFTYSEEVAEHTDPGVTLARLTFANTLSLLKHYYSIFRHVPILQLPQKVTMQKLKWLEQRLIELELSAKVLATCVEYPDLAESLVSTIKEYRQRYALALRSRKAPDARQAAPLQRESLSDYSSYASHGFDASDSGYADPLLDLGDDDEMETDFFPNRDIHSFNASVPPVTPQQASKHLKQEPGEFYPGNKFHQTAATLTPSAPSRQKTDIYPKPESFTPPELDTPYSYVYTRSLKEKTGNVKENAPSFYPSAKNPVPSNYPPGTKVKDEEPERTKESFYAGGGASTGSRGDDASSTSHPSSKSNMSSSSYSSGTKPKTEEPERRDSFYGAANNTGRTQPEENFSLDEEHDQDGIENEFGVFKDSCREKLRLYEFTVLEGKHMNKRCTLVHFNGSNAKVLDIASGDSFYLSNKTRICLHEKVPQSSRPKDVKQNTLSYFRDSLKDKLRDREFTLVGGKHDGKRCALLHFNGNNAKVLDVSSGDSFYVTNTTEVKLHNKSS